MHTYQKALFGGALMSAGMVANAQTFNFLDTDVTGSFNSYSYLVDVNDGGYGYTNSILVAPAALSQSRSGDTDLNIVQSSNLLRVDGTWSGNPANPYGYAGASLQQFFTTSADAVLRVSWDVSGTDAYAGAFIIEDASGSVLFQFDGLGGDPLAGTVDVPVSAGTTYAAILQLGTPGFFTQLTSPFLFNTDTQFIQAALIPAPASLALLGLGGLAATRRRR
ncbi:MAG: PEP-CTERM sorting domain-containing protein [Planctomycetota bacterium]